MDVKDFYYDLPEELIAQDPLEDRSSSRLLVLNKDTGEIQHKVFRDILSYLRKGDCLVINDTKVIPARLIGSKEGTDAKIEVLLLKRYLGDACQTWKKSKNRYGNQFRGRSFKRHSGRRGRGRQQADSIFLQRNIRGDSGRAWTDATAAIYHTPAAG